MICWMSSTRMSRFSLLAMVAYPGILRPFFFFFFFFLAFFFFFFFYF